MAYFQGPFHRSVQQPHPNGNRSNGRQRVPWCIHSGGRLCGRQQFGVHPTKHPTVHHQHASVQQCHGTSNQRFRLGIDGRNAIAERSVTSNATTACTIHARPTTNGSTRVASNCDSAPNPSICASSTRICTPSPRGIWRTRTGWRTKANWQQKTES